MLSDSKVRDRPKECDDLEPRPSVRPSVRPFDCDVDVKSSLSSPSRVLTGALELPLTGFVTVSREMSFVCSVRVANEFYTFPG